MSELVGLYEAYLHDLSESSLANFIDYSLEYNFFDYKNDTRKMYDLYNDFDKEVETISVHSNGSTNKTKTEYEIGPNARFLIQYLEKKQRNNLERVLINFRQDFYQVERFYFRENAIFSDLTSEKGAEYLISCFDQIRHEDFILETTPNVVLAMTCHENLIEYLSKNKLRVVSTGDDALYDKNKINALDRMVDWKTGVNFFECSHGRKHIFPIWFEKGRMAVNLLNLNKKKHKKSDIIEIKSFEKCECGKMACNFELVPHYRNRPKLNGKYITNLDIINKINGKYTNLQFIQKKDEESFFVFYDIFRHDGVENIMPQKDAEEIKLYLKDSDIQFVKNMQYLVGLQKFMKFWKEDQNGGKICNSICTII